MALLPVRRLALALAGLLTALLVFAAPAAAAAIAPDRGAAAQQVEDEIPEDEIFDEEPGEEIPFDEDEELIDDEAADYVDEEVLALEQATAELGRAKRAVAGKVARLGHSASVLRPCQRGGPGWKRIRAIDHGPQRALYTAAARRLLADMRLLLDGQQPRIVVFESAFTRFVAQLRAAPIADPTLSEAVAAQARRLAAYHDVRGVKANCATFNKLIKRVREFPTAAPLRSCVPTTARHRSRAGSSVTSRTSWRRSTAATESPIATPRRSRARPS